MLVKERRKVATDMGRHHAEAELIFPVAAPWDLKRGRVIDGENEFDVRATRASKRLVGILDVTAVSHWGNECRSFSRARGKPIPGVPGGDSASCGTLLTLRGPHGSSRPTAGRRRW